MRALSAKNRFENPETNEKLDTDGAVFIPHGNKGAGILVSVEDGVVLVSASGGPAAVYATADEVETGRLVLQLIQ
jgi:hypothetical protein